MFFCELLLAVQCVECARANLKTYHGYQTFFYDFNLSKFNRKQKWEWNCNFKFYYFNIHSIRYFLLCTIHYPSLWVDLQKSPQQIATKCEKERKSIIFSSFRLKYSCELNWTLYFIAFSMFFPLYFHFYGRESTINRCNVFSWTFQIQFEFLRRNMLAIK